MSRQKPRFLRLREEEIPKIRPGATIAGAEKGSAIKFDHYIYHDLPPGPNFRLLELLPKTHPLSQGGAHVVVSLWSVSIDASANQCEALSYNWEDPYALNLLLPDVPRARNKYGSVSCAISIDGQFTVPVTPNLFLALRALRLEMSPWTLWVDALCINQSSPEEKSSQIPLMTEIYAEASKVIIWLGDEDRWTSGSISVIRRWAGIHAAAQKTGAHQPEILARLKEWQTFEVEEQACFEAFVRRAWFTRAWTFQELCLARDAELRCGKYTIPWARFRDACATVIAAGQENFVFEEHKNVKTLIQFYDLCQQVPARYERAQDERFQLSRLVQRTRLQQVTDPRDKLYSLLGIANRPTKNEGAYQVRYDECARDVYCRFTRDMIQEDGDLGILSAVQRIQSPTKSLEYAVRPLALHSAKIQRSETQAKVKHVQSLGELIADVEKSQLVLWRDEQRTSMPEVFKAPELESPDSVVKGLLSWVPNFATQDVVEYVMADANIRSDLPEDLIRTKFPRPLSQQLDDETPLYRLQKWRSSRKQPGSVTFDMGNSDHLGVWGVKIGTIKRVFEMPFTSDPTVRISTGHTTLKPQAPPAPNPFNFDFIERFWPVEDSRSAADEPLLKDADYYRHIGERVRIAVLRTVTADMLPISSRLPDSHKKMLFPLHYDFEFWNNGPDYWPRSFPSLLPSSSSRFDIWNPAYGSHPPMLIEMLRLVALTTRVLRARLALWLRGGDPSAPWTEFDAGELRRGWRIEQLYHGLLTLPGDTLVATRFQDYSRRASFSFTRLILTAVLTEGVLKWYWKNLWAPGTMLEGVPTHWVWATVWMAVYGLGVVLSTRWARRFERDVSMPVGWENGASRVSKIIESGFPEGADMDGILGLWGISCEIQNAVNRASWNREFLITDNEYMGIGPVGMREGDEIWTLIGGHAPFVLRPSGQTGGSITIKQYKLVGESYVHGIMDGEAWSGAGYDWSDIDRVKAQVDKVILV